MNYDVIGSGKLIHTQVPRASPLSNLFRPVFCSPIICFQEKPKLLIFILVSFSTLLQYGKPRGDLARKQLIFWRSWAENSEHKANDLAWSFNWDFYLICVNLNFISFHFLQHFRWSMMFSKNHEDLRMWGFIYDSHSQFRWSF